MRKTAERLIKSLNTLVDFMIISVILLLVFFAIFQAWETGRIYRDADAEKLASYKPETENDLSFEELKKINPDTIGWLDLYGTQIDYPVVQGKDNNSYINRDIFGSFSLTGALFLDYKNSPDFMDYNNVIYGHHMEKNKMFGSLDEFKNKKYLKKHSTGNLYANNRNYGIKVFAWLDVDAYDPDIYNTEIDAPADRKILIDILKRNSSVFLDGIADPNGHILLLSTCGTDTTNERYILATVITKETYANPYADDEGKSLENKGGFFEEHGCLIFWILLLLLLIVACILYRRHKNKKRERERLANYDKE